MQFHPSDKTPLLADAAVQATGSSGGALAGECTGERAGGQASRFVSCDWRGRPVQVEYQWLAPERQQTPLLVFLHEGLGSLSMWKDFPQRLCDAAQCRGLVYSRPGYGRSSSRAVDEAWGPDFMHRQAHDLLPALFDALGVDTLAHPPWLLGHSDGASIALLYAARFADRVAGTIVLAPHIEVEAQALASIEAAREAYLDTDLQARLARHHDDPDSAFWGWSSAWLNPLFRHWSIVDEMANIRCPLLALQGLDDEYGTMEQIRGIARRAPQTQLVELSDCGHGPQRDQPQRVIAACVDFMATAGASRREPGAA